MACTLGFICPVRRVVKCLVKLPINSGAIDPICWPEILFLNKMLMLIDLETLDLPRRLVTSRSIGVGCVSVCAHYLCRCYSYRMVGIDAKLLLSPRGFTPRWLLNL